MDRSNVINLISVTYQKDDIGQRIPQETKKSVFCNIQSISQNEFFEAGRNGLNPQYKVTMFRYDYGGEEIVELNGKRYGVYRTYFSQNETAELYLEKKSGV